MKYFLKSNNQEIKLGQTIELSTPVDTSYGKGAAIVKVTVTEPVLAKLVEDGFVKNVLEEKDAKSPLASLKPFYKSIARENNISLLDAINLCEIIYEMCPTAHLELLITTIAKVNNRNKPVGNNVWWLNPLKGYKPTVASSNIKGVVFFHTEQGASEAYILLKPFIDEILDGE